MLYSQQRQGLVCQRPSDINNSTNNIDGGIMSDALPSPGVNPLEGSPKCSCGKLGFGRRSNTIKGQRGVLEVPGLDQEETSRSSLNLHPKQITKWLVHIPGHPWVLGQATGTLDHKTHHGPDSGEATTFPHIVFSALLREDYIQMVLFPGTPKLESRNCPGWSPGTLGAHNSRLPDLIATRSKPKLWPSSRSFQRHVALSIRRSGRCRFPTFGGWESNCQFDSRPFFCP